MTDWSRESWQVARDAAYGTALGDPCGPVPARVTLGDAKITTLVPIVRRQIVRGATRLARLLDESLTGR